MSGDVFTAQRGIADAQARGPGGMRKKGRALSMYRLDCSQASALRRKNQASLADRIIKDGKARLMRTLVDRRGAFSVLRHATQIMRVLSNIEREEAADLFADGSDARR